MFLMAERHRKVKARRIHQDDESHVKAHKQLEPSFPLICTRIKVLRRGRCMGERDRVSIEAVEVSQSCLLFSSHPSCIST